jgi:hypothetical protein
MRVSTKPGNVSIAESKAIWLISAHITPRESTPSKPPSLRNNPQCHSCCLCCPNYVPSCFRFSIKSLSKPVDSETSIHSLYNVLRIVHDQNISAVLTPYALTKNLNVMSYVNQMEKPSKTLIDSGTMGNFIHENLVQQLKLTRHPQSPLPLLDVKGIRIGEL